MSSVTLIKPRIVQQIMAKPKLFRADKLATRCPADTCGEMSVNVEIANSIHSHHHLPLFNIQGMQPQCISIFYALVMFLQDFENEEQGLFCPHQSGHTSLAVLCCQSVVRNYCSQ